MKSYYRLLNYEIKSLLRPLILLYIGVIISPLILLDLATKNYNIIERFEIYYQSSGCVTLFIIFLAILCGICLKNIYSNYWGSKSIYTLLGLPIKREALYWSKLTALIVAFAGIIAAQLLSVILAYLLFYPRVSIQSSGGVFYTEKLINNGLSLAFIRSNFLRILLPLGREGLMASLAILISITSSLIYGIFCERSGKYYGFILISLVMVLITVIISKRSNMNVYLDRYNSLGSSYLPSIILLILTAFLIWHSIELVRSSSIA